MLIQRDLIIGEVNWGVIVTLENIGDELPPHTHQDEETNHITILLNGAIMLLGDAAYNGTVVEARPGGVIINWKIGQEHGMRAMTPGATFANLRKKR